MSSHNLPPVTHLPQWPRVGRLGVPHCPRRLMGNQQPVVTPTDRGGVGRAEEVSRHSDTDHRVASMPGNINFLQQQHKDTLERLHAEIEHLRRQNKELQYKLIMEPPKSRRKGMTHSQRGTGPTNHGSAAQMGPHLEDTRPTQGRGPSIGEGSRTLGSAGQDHGPEVRGGLITSLQPLRIQISPSHPPHAPSVQQCEVIIRQLYAANSLQSQEIVRVRALLRDILLSKKITPENHILTKAYLHEATRKSSEEKKFPKLGLQAFPEKKCGSSQAAVVFPALKQSLSSTAAERQRRTRGLQRGRFVKRMVQ